MHSSHSRRLSEGRPLWTGRAASPQQNRTQWPGALVHQTALAATVALVRVVPHLGPGAVVIRLDHVLHAEGMVLLRSLPVVAETHSLERMVLVGVEVRVKQLRHCCVSVR